MRNDVLAVLGESLKAIRSEKRLSVDELAEASHISSTELDEVESARKAISLDQLVSLSSALNVPMLRLFLCDEYPVDDASSDHWSEVSFGTV